MATRERTEYSTFKHRPGDYLLAIRARFAELSFFLYLISSPNYSSSRKRPQPTGVIVYVDGGSGRGGVK